MDLSKCNIPCEGIYANWIRKDIEDLQANDDFQVAYKEYQNYIDAGVQLVPLYLLKHLKLYFLKLSEIPTLTKQ